MLPLIKCCPQVTATPGSSPSTIYTIVFTRGSTVDVTCYSYDIVIFVIITPLCYYRLAIDSVIMKVVKLCCWKVSCGDGDSESCCTTERARAWAESSIWFALSLVLALFVPRIKYVVSPLGCLAAVFIMVLPGMCFWVSPPILGFKISVKVKCK